MLPALAVLVGYSDETKSEQHVYQAASLWVNVAVAWSATRSHRAAKATDCRATALTLPGMIAGMITGVAISNFMKGEALKWALVLFIWAFSSHLVISIWRKKVKHAAVGASTTALSGRAVLASIESPGAGLSHPEAVVTQAQAVPPGAGGAPKRRGWGWFAGIGAFTGVPSGILGIGGGILLVPLLQLLGRVDLRRSISVSASVMWVSSLVGAILKTATLHEHGHTIEEAFWYAGPIGLTAMVGSRIGAKLTHKLPTVPLKLLIAAILSAAGARMAGLF